MKKEDSTLLKYNKIFKGSLYILTTSLLIFISIQLYISAVESQEKSFLQKQDFSSEGGSLEDVSELPPFLENEIESLELEVSNHNYEYEINLKVDKLNRIFIRYGSYLSREDAMTIVMATERCGGDYKVIGALAGSESGFGRINYKLYNPFGYLDGVQYASQQEALEILTCKIAQQYLVPCNNDVVCISNTGYTGTDTDVPKWIRTINYFINLIDNA